MCECKCVCVKGREGVHVAMLTAQMPTMRSEVMERAGPVETSVFRL